MKHDGCFVSTVELGEEREARGFLQQQLDKVSQEGPGSSVWAGEGALGTLAPGHSRIGKI